MAEVRLVDDDEHAAWAAAVRCGMLQPPGTDGPIVSKNLGPERYLAAVEDGAIVATMRDIRLRISVPGGAMVPACGLTSVMVAATHRRRGLLTEMMTAQLAAAKQAGIALAVLVSSRYPIYGRFGFGPAIYKTGLQIDARALHPMRDLPGRTAFADASQMRRHAPAIYRQAALHHAGSVERPDAWWDHHLGPDGSLDAERIHALAHEPDGGVCGYASFRHIDQWSAAERPEGTAKVSELIAHTPQAQARLWITAASHDWISTVTAGGQPVDLIWPLLLTDARAVHQTHRIDALWARVLDPAHALACRSYATPGALRIRVVDPLAVAAGTVHLETDADSKVSCTPDRNSPDITITVAALGSLLFGGHSVRELVALGDVEEHTTGAAARADAMFHTAHAPWRPTSF